MITESDVAAALSARAVPEQGGGWRFPSGIAHTEASARSIARICLTLGVPVTDILTADMFLRVVLMMDELRDRVAALESSRC